jgi:methionyl aminopeptidase
MINLGKKEVVTGRDGWTISTKDKLPSAHYEHTVALVDGKADILSSFEGIEAAVAQNSWLQTVGIREVEQAK